VPRLKPAAVPAGTLVVLMANGPVWAWTLAAVGAGPRWNGLVGQ